MQISVHRELADDAADDGAGMADEPAVAEEPPRDADDGVAGGEEGLVGGEEGLPGGEDDCSPEPGWQMYVVPHRPQYEPEQQEPNAVTQLS